MKQAGCRLTLQPQLKPKLKPMAVSFLCLIFSVMVTAQVKTESSTTKGESTVDIKVERGEVVNVSGNDLVVKMEDGEVRHFPNVPDTAKITVDGRELTIHDLKPGMKLERTITTTTTPQTVKTVQTVTGKVWQVSPPNTVILTLEDGTNQKFDIPKGQKFTVDGQETDAFGLKKGQRISATKIVTVPQDEISQERKVTGHIPQPPTEQIQGPLLIEAAAAEPATQVAQAEPAPEPAQGEEAATEMPQTASPLPLMGLVGIFAVLAGAALLGKLQRVR